MKHEADLANSTGVPVFTMYLLLIAASEASSDTIFDDSRTTCAPADDKNPVPAGIIGSQTKMLWPE